MIKLQLPLRNIQVTQPFGANYLNFYQQWGMKGHNGIDFRAMDGFNCYAAHAGQVTFAQTYDDGGVAEGKKPMKHVEIWDAKNKFKTIYLHLEDYIVNVGDTVQSGQIIGHCDNTGKYTTGNHLHFGLKQVDENGNTLNKDNGYNGAIDPSPYFYFAYNGMPLNPKDFDKSNAYHRYFRKDKRNLQIEIKILGVLTRYLRRLPSVEQINACVYGAWDREAIQNPAMHENYGFLTKGDILSGKKPFQD